MDLDTRSVSSGPEEALTSVRWALCILAVVAHGAVAIARGSAANALIMAATGTLLLVGCVVVARLATRWGQTRPLLLQVVDTGWWIGLVLFAGDLVPAGAWALLTIPIVGASIRGSELHVLSTWFVAAGTYLGVTTSVSRLAPQETGTVINALGILLAVAAGVAVLTRWLAEGWVDQQALTESADQRRAWLEQLQGAARAMRKLSPPEVLEVCLQTAVDLGFDAVSARGNHVSSTQSAPFAQLMNDIEVPPEDTIEIAAHRQGDDGLVFSAVGVEPRSQTVLVAWSTQNPSDELAAALGDLIAQTTLAFETATHLAAAKFDATHDSLTGLANRRRLDELLDLHQDQAAVVFIDLDKFKPINDDYGHDVGDRVLRILADRIDNAASDRGLAVRYGGDEFVVLLTGEHVVAAAGVAASIAGQLRDPVVVDGRAFELSGSVGVATTNDASLVGSLLEAADARSYEAKRAGGDRVVGASLA